MKYSDVSNCFRTANKKASNYPVKHKRVRILSVLYKINSDYPLKFLLSHFHILYLQAPPLIRQTINHIFRTRQGSLINDSLPDFHLFSVYERKSVSAPASPCSSIQRRPWHQSIQRRSLLATFLIGSRRQTSYIRRNASIRMASFKLAKIYFMCCVCIGVNKY